MQRLREKLLRIDRKGYKAYKGLKGEYKFPNYTLLIESVQSDPFAPPSRIRVSLSMSTAGFPFELYSNNSKKTGLEDFLLRKAYMTLKSLEKRRGTGKSGILDIQKPGQEILKQTGVVVKDGRIEARFFIGLPALGRTILARDAEEIFFRSIPEFVRRALLFDKRDYKKLKEHTSLVEDQDYLREKLKQMGLVSFIKDNSILPRRSGIDSRPMEKGAIPFKSPESLRVKINLPNRGEVTGMGIPEGITLIAGGGYHGKTTLLLAIQNGVYNHIEGDGREFVITVKNAIKIRAEDGRRIEKVDISPFINNLPMGMDTRDFSTDNASGSTSQAANIIEAIEAGAELLLLDEDTSATNFMIRDKRMQLLVAKDNEPITPFIDKVKSLYKDYGVSTILVMGGSGDYLDIADRVIVMENFIPKDATEKAKMVVKKVPSDRRKEGGERFGRIRERVIRPEGFNPRRGRKEVKIDTPSLNVIRFGRESINLSSVEQIVNINQTKSIGYALLYILKNGIIDGRRTLRDILRVLERELVSSSDYDKLSPFGIPMGEFKEIRPLEVASAINRMRSLKVSS